MSITREEIIELGFKHLGSGWFCNEDDTIRIRKWRDSEIDFYRWWNNDDNKLHFRGKLETIYEVKWVLERCFPNYNSSKQENLDASEDMVESNDNVKNNTFFDDYQIQSNGKTIILLHQNGNDKEATISQLKLMIKGIEDDFDWFAG